MAVFDPAEAGSKRSSLSVLVESVRADGKDLPSTPDGARRAPSGTRRFEVNYTALDLASPSTLRFRYKLESMDANWVEAGAQRVAQYSQLPPREYEFRVMAGGNDGQWHEADRKVRLQVVPRLWERRWMQLLTTGLVFSLLVGGLAWRHRRQLRLKLERLEMEQRVEKERRRIARDLHDELGSRLTRIANLGELAMTDTKPPNDMKSQLGSMTGGVRELINAMDEVVWTVSPKNDSLPNLAAFLSDYIERFVAPTKISYRLELDPEFPTLPLAAEARHHVLLAVKEALNNAVRHATPRIIRLKIHVQDGWLEVAVADDGHGFEVEKAKEGGHGLSNLVRRMELIKGRAEIRSEAGKGTTVTLSMPLAAGPEHR